MIERKNPTTNPFQAYLASFAKTGSHDTAFREAFGTDVDGMDKELRQYVRRVTMGALTFDIQAERQASDEARSITDADMNALEGRLLLQACAAAHGARPHRGE